MKLAVLLGLWSAIPQSAVRIQVRVINLAHVPPQDLLRAEEIVNHIFRNARIDPVWVDCDAAGRPCSGDAQAGDLWLQLLPKQPPMLEPNAAGYALLVPDCAARCGYAAISIPTIQSIAHQVNSDPDCLLGAAIAHEIGHLLLGPHSHTREGIMSPHFGRGQIQQAGQGMLLFNADQARRLHNSIAKGE